MGTIIGDCIGTSIIRDPFPHSLLSNRQPVQVIYRLIWGWRASSRMKRFMKDTPATKGPGHDAPAVWLKDLIANRDRLHDWRLDISQGQPVSKNLGFSWHPGMNMLIVNDAEVVRHILKDEFNKYTKSELRYDPFFFYVQDFLGDGIFVVKHGVGSEDRGQDWGNMRKVSSQIFSRTLRHNISGLVGI